MPRVLRAAVVIAIVLASVGAPASAAATGAGWHVTQTLLKVVRFADPNVGWAAGGKSAVLGTRDGGSHWTRQRLGLRGGPVSFRSVATVGVDRCWLLGGASLYRTVNGGSTWKRSGVGPRPIRRGDTWDFMDFATSRAGWVVSGRGDIVKTGNGGASWVRQRRSAAGRGSVAAISVVSSRVAFAAFNGPRRHCLLATRDGRHWHAVGPAGPGISTSPLAGVSAESAYTAWVSTRAGEVFVTLDGGTTWTQINDKPPVGPGTLKARAMDACGNTVCVVGGDASAQGAAILAPNGVRAWRWLSIGATPAPAPATFTSVDFVTPTIDRKSVV